MNGAIHEWCVQRAIMILKGTLQIHLSSTRKERCEIWAVNVVVCGKLKKFAFIVNHICLTPWETNTGIAVDWEQNKVSYGPLYGWRWSSSSIYFCWCNWTFCTCSFTVFTGRCHKSMNLSFKTWSGDNSMKTMTRSFTDHPWEDPLRHW